MIVNLTVWETVEALRAFAYRTTHVEYLRRRREWFEPARRSEPRPVVGAGRVTARRSTRPASGSTGWPPTGPTPAAFTLKTTFPPGG